MKHVCYLTFMILVALLSGCHSQQEVTQMDIYNHQVAQQVIGDKAFVVKGQRLNIKNRYFAGISPSTNFLLVDGENATVQVSPGVGGGPNGVGGFTVNGKITGFKAQTKSNGEINVSYHVQAIAGSCDVMIKVFKKTNQATATITGTFNGGRATLYGELVPIDNSIHKGYSRY